MHRWDTLQRLLGRGSIDLVPLVARALGRTEDEANELLLQSSAALARQVRDRHHASLPGLGDIEVRDDRPRFELGGMLDQQPSDPDAVAWMTEVEAESVEIEEACRTAARALEASAVTSRGVRWPGLGVLEMKRVPTGLRPELRWERHFTSVLS